MRTLFVLNPAAAHGRAASRWQSMIAEVRAGAGFASTEVWHTRGRGHGAELARRGLAQGFEAIVAVGGDGTLSEVAHGYLTAPELERARAIVGTWPVGSACDTARRLGLEPGGGPEKLLAMLAARKVRRLDVGRVHYTGERDAGGCRYFVNIAALGLAGEVARRVERSGKPFGGRWSYLLASLRALFSARPDLVELVIDGRREPPTPLHLAVVANSSTFGGGMRIAEGADMQDGQLDLITVGGLPKWRLLLNFPKIYKGSHLGVEGVRRTLVRRVEASAQTPVWLNIDGEALGRLPAVFEILPAALPFLVP